RQKSFQQVTHVNAKKCNLLAEAIHISKREGMIVSIFSYQRIKDEMPYHPIDKYFL
ncbi:15586_t:CDS:1, partial [Cetraspora pellucida]